MDALIIWKIFTNAVNDYCMKTDIETHIIYFVKV